MTIEKYLQDKVDINEISKDSKDFILNELKKAYVSKIDKWMLCYFLLQFCRHGVDTEIEEMDLLREMLKLKLADFYIATFSIELEDLAKKGFVVNINGKYSIAYDYLKKLEKETTNN